MVNISFGQSPTTSDARCSEESLTRSRDESGDDASEELFIKFPSLKREPGLLRVVPPSRVLYRFAAVFRENEAWTQVPYQSQVGGSSSANAPLLLANEHLLADKVYCASEPASRVGAFISHVWASARWRKALALCYHLNVNLAVILATLAWVLLLSILRFRADWSESPDLRHVLMCVPIAVFSLAFFLGHYVYAPVQSMWLDKLCIHQTRDDLKERGVRALPEIVAKSDRMVVLWDTAYFERLWCCAEVAIFTAVQGSAERVEIAPLWIAPWVLSNMVSVICSISCFPWLVELVHDYIPGLLARGGVATGAACYLLATLPAAPLSCFALRRKMEDHRRMLLQFEGFRLQDTECKVEGDRDQVYELVSQLYTEAAHPIEAFNHFVRTDLSCHIERSFGRVTRIRYRLSLLLGLPLVFATDGDISDTIGCSSISCNQVVREVLGPGAHPSELMLVNVIVAGISLLAVFPSVYPVMLRLMAACERSAAQGRPRRLEALQVVATAASNACIALMDLLLAELVYSTSRHLRHSSVSTSLPWCVALAAFLIFLGWWNYYLFR